MWTGSWGVSRGIWKEQEYAIKWDLKGPELGAQLEEAEKVFKPLRDDTPDCGGTGSSLQKSFSDFPVIIGTKSGVFIGRYVNSDTRTRTPLSWLPELILLFIITWVRSL